MTEEAMCYVGIKPCGCCVAAAVDNPEWAKDTAKAVSKWMRDGLTIERRTVQWSRENLTMCEHKKPAKQTALAL
jgi:hypothetical protein